MICDVCSAKVSEGEGTRITASDFCHLLDRGFGLDPTNVKMLMSGGVTREQAESMLKQQYRQSKSDWLLCPACAVGAKTAREPAPEPIRTQTQSKPPLRAESFFKAVGAVIGVIIFLVVGLNSCVRVSQGPDRPSKGIVTWWLTK